MDDTYNFRATVFPVKIFSGVDALNHLTKVLEEHQITKALVLCGRTVGERTNLVSRVREIAGARICGVFSEISEGAERRAVEAAARRAEELGADALIAIGAGSVTKAARVVAMLMAEKKPLEEIATRYVPGEPAKSVYLSAPKCPIINVMTAASTSQHRAGSAIRDENVNYQFEFFDPKTRPKAVFWDAQALLSAPASLARATGMSQYWWGLMNIASVNECNPLVQASRHHVWRLAQDALPRISDPQDYSARIDLCAAAMLQVRDEDDDGRPLGGRPMRSHLIKRVPYMLSTGLFNGTTRVNQSKSLIALTGPAIRHFGDLCIETVAELGSAMGLPVREIEPHLLISAVADRYEQVVSDLGAATDLRGEGVTESHVPAVIAYGLRNFNTNNDGLLNDKVERLERVLLSVI